VALAEPQMIDGTALLGVWSAGQFFSLGPVPDDI